MLVKHCAGQKCVLSEVQKYASKLLQISKLAVVVLSFNHFGQLYSYPVVFMDVLLEGRGSWSVKFSTHFQLVGLLMLKMCGATHVCPPCYMPLLPGA